MSPAQEDPPSGTPPIVFQYFNVARRRIWVIAAIMAATLIAGLILTLLATPEYTATSRIEISRLQANVTNVESLQREEPGASQEFYSTQYALLEAKSLATRVARQLRLSRDEAFFAASGTTPAGQDDLSGSTGPIRPEVLQKREEQAVNILLANISISPVRGSALINVSYTSSSPQYAAKVANAWVGEFVRQSMDRRFASTADARVFLEERLAGLRQRLEQSERDLVNYAEQENIVPLTETREEGGATRTTRTLATSDVEALNLALQQATAERVAAEGKLRAAQRSGPGQSSFENTTLNELRRQLAQKEADYASMTVRFEPRYPAAQALAGEIASLRGAIGSEEQRITSSYVSQFEAARQREGQLRQRVDQLLDRLQAENRSSIQFNIIQREVDTNRQLYDALLQRYKEIGVAGVGTNNIAVVDVADIPEVPSSPVLLVNLALAFVFGIVLAAIVVFILENIDESIREPHDVQEKLKTPLLGAIPRTDEPDSEQQLQDPKSILFEAYMTVRTNLAFSTDHGVPKTLSLTSSEPAEGKSTSSFGLASVLARTGKSVVLVDVDMRRPMLGTMTGVSYSRGVSNYLAGDDDWRSLVSDAGLGANLAFIPSGPAPPSASELLTSDRLPKLINALAVEYDHVVVDSPPMLGFSDAVLIARCVEGTIYIVESEQTSTRASRAALKRLTDAGAHLLGVILTKYASKQAGYGYGYGYGYRYGQDRNEEVV